MARIEERQVVVDSLRCSYLHAGTGPAVILLHGWGQSNATWKDIVPTLASSYSVYALDLPGFGKSDVPPHAWTVQDYADFVNELTRALGIDVFAVIGHSFGARVAASYASSYPLEKLILVAMGKEAGRSIFRSLNVALIRTFGHVVPRTLFDMHRRTLTQRRYADESSLTSVRAKRMLSTYLSTHGTDALALSSIKVPTLLVYGKRDPITPMWIGSRVSRLIAGSKLVVLPEAGHFVHIKNVELLLRHIRDFLT